MRSSAFIAELPDVVFRSTADNRNSVWRHNFAFIEDIINNQYVAIPITAAAPLAIVVGKSARFCKQSGIVPPFRDDRVTES